MWLSRFNTGGKYCLLHHYCEIVASYLTHAYGTCLGKCAHQALHNCLLVVDWLLHSSMSRTHSQSTSERRRMDHSVSVHHSVSVPVFWDWSPIQLHWIRSCWNLTWFSILPAQMGNVFFGRSRLWGNYKWITIFVWCISSIDKPVGKPNTEAWR